MDWVRTVGARIRQFRQMRGMTIEALALAAHVNPRYLGSIERGRNSASVVILGKLAEALDVHPADFFRD